MSDPVKYHINGKGEPDICPAKVRCRLGLPLEEHFQSKEEAYAYIAKEAEAKGLSATQGVKKAPAQARTTKKATPKPQAVQPATDSERVAHEALQKHFPQVPVTQGQLRLAGELLETPESGTKAADGAIRLMLSETGGMGHFGRERGNFELTTDPDGDCGIVRADALPADDEPLYAQIYTRNGGGNREYWDDGANHGPECGCSACTMDRVVDHPLYVDDEDDEDDGTYATITFRVPQEYRAQLRKLLTPEPEGARDRRLVAGMIRGGNVNPSWLTEDADLDEVATKGNELRRAREDLARFKNSLDTLRDPRRDRDARGYVDAQKLKLYLDGEVDLVSTEGTYRFDKSFTFGTPLKEFKKDVEDMRTSRQERDKLARVKAAVEASGDEELKAWALGQREERSYFTTEGRGRSKRRVESKYRPEAPLEKDLNAADGSYNRTKKKVDEYAAALQRDTEAYEKRVEELQRRVDEAQAAIEERSRAH